MVIIIIIRSTNSNTNTISSITSIIYSKECFSPCIVETQSPLNPSLETQSPKP